MGKTFVLISSIFFATNSAFATDYLEGTLYERGSNYKNILFKFVKEAKIEAGRRVVHCRYTDPQGKLALEEKIEYRPDGSLEKYWRQQNQIDEVTKIERKGETVLFYKSEKGKVVNDDEKWKSANISTDQVSDFIRDHWQELMAGKSLDIRILVPSRTETVGFSIEKLNKAGDVNGKESIIFEMSASSMIIRAIVDPILFHYETAAPHRLLLVDGRMPVKGFSKNGDYHDLDGPMLFRVDNQILDSNRDTQKTQM